MPRRALPCERTSSVVTILASSPGCRYITPVTISPSVIFSVLAATYPSVVYPSSIGSSTSAVPSIWKKWSITVNEETPACSTIRAVSARVGAIAAGSAGVE
jgi:hypothetical protein